MVYEPSLELVSNRARYTDRTVVADDRADPCFVTRRRSRRKHLGHQEGLEVANHEVNSDPVPVHFVQTDGTLGCRFALHIECK